MRVKKVRGGGGAGRVRAGGMRAGRAGALAEGEWCGRGPGSGEGAGEGCGGGRGRRRREKAAGGGRPGASNSKTIPDEKCNKLKPARRPS